MQIKKGEKLVVKHKTHGTFKCVASADFDTEKAAFYPVKVSWSNGPVYSRAQDYYEGEKIPCDRAKVIDIKKLEAKSETTVDKGTKGNTDAGAGAGQPAAAKIPRAKSGASS